MTHEQFTIWLQGYLEVSGKKELSEEEARIIREKLASVVNPVVNNFFNSMQGLNLEFVGMTC